VTDHVHYDGDVVPCKGCPTDDGTRAAVCVIIAAVGFGFVLGIVVAGAL
jgi:hypothetical protein